MSKIVIVAHPERKRPQVRRERKDVFSDETNLYLLRLLRKDSGLPDALGGGAVGGAAMGGSATVQRNLQLELAAAIRQRVLPWFWSISLHLALLILLASILYQVNRFEPIDMLSGIANIPLQRDHPVLGPLGNENGMAPNVAEENQNGAQEDVEERAAPDPVHPSPGLNLSGRDPDLRAAMLGGGGGGGQTDEAVLAGLRWLVRVQEPDGTWRFSSRSFSQSATPSREDALAATAMALLAFQGFGVTPTSNHPMLIEFVHPVRRGWEWLIRQQNPDGSFFAERPEIGIHRFYTHAFCTIALCELLIMTGDERYREPAQRAIDYFIRHQSIRSGGWRYLPDRFSDQSDVSVTGWVVLALKSGEAAGLTVPPETYDRVMRFLDAMMFPSNHYMYRAEEPRPRIAMTAQASLCRILLGWRRDNPRLAGSVRLILDSPPTFAEHGRRDVYYWFFATQTLYHLGGNEWQTWNSIMREELLRNQETFGPERGSWHPRQPVMDAWSQYGRLYVTCMSLYILQVYYRHFRIFP